MLQPVKHKGALFGYYKPVQRIHIDQVPITLDINARRTYVESRAADRAAVAGMPSQEKRFATFQIAFHGDSSKQQPQIGNFLFIL